MVLQRIDRLGQEFYTTIQKAWAETTFREIFGIGMIAIALVAAYKPSGSILLAQNMFGIDPLLHAVWYALCGYLLARYGHRGRWAKYFYTFPMFLYIGLTVVWINQNWERSNLIVLIQYIMLYIGMIKLIIDES